MSQERLHQPSELAKLKEYELAEVLLEPIYNNKAMLKELIKRSVKEIKYNKKLFLI